MKPPQLSGIGRVLSAIKPTASMNSSCPPPQESWESDAVWDLLEKAPPVTASHRFTDEVVRSARTDAGMKSWWHRIFSPAPLIGIATVTAAVALAVVSLVQPETHAAPHIAVNLNSPQAVAIQDIAETEALIAAADRLDDYSDNELVSLIGF